LGFDFSESVGCPIKASHAVSLAAKPLQDAWATLAGAEKVDHPLTRKRQGIKPTRERAKIGLSNNLMSKTFGHAAPPTTASASQAAATAFVVAVVRAERLQVLLIAG